MTPFDQALTHLLDVLSRADATQIGRASQESLQRLAGLARPSAQPLTAPPTPASRTSAPPQTLASPTPASRQTAPPTEAPRRKLGLAEQLRAVMASGEKPVFQEAEGPTSTPPSSLAPEPTPAAPPPSVAHLPPEAQLEHLNETLMAAAGDPRRTVPGWGNARAELVFIGEAPGEAEIAAGMPLAGEVGALFDKIIATMRLKKGDLYLSNILKTPSEGAAPSPDEIASALPMLHSEIEIIRPKCIVALGQAAFTGLVGRADSIRDVRGEWHSFRGIPVMATLPPAYLYENESKQIRRLFWEDMLQVLELLARPITPKQREFFK